MTGETPAVRATDISKSFGSGESAITAVETFSVTVETGEVVGVLGPNGAGKTTAIKSVLGLLSPDTGTVELAGTDVTDAPARVGARVGAMLEGARNVYWRLTVRENLRLFAGLGGDSASSVADRHDRLLDLFGLTDDAETVVRDLSRGTKQKVAVASTLARDVDAVVLDEPTLGLDVSATADLRRELRRLADRENLAVLLTSHDLDTVEAVCDRVVLVRDGVVVADGPVEELLGRFDWTEYRITVAGELDPAARRRLDTTFDADVVSDEEPNRIRVVVSLREPDRLYDLLGVVRGAGRTVTAVESVDPGLAELFAEVFETDPVTGGAP